MSGSRVVRYKHELPAKIKFDPPDLAVLCELMLRGPQTAGELRTHTGRLCAQQSLEQIEETLRGLTDWGGEVYVVKLPPGPGRREPRYAQRLTTEVAADAFAETSPAEAPPVTFVPVQDRLCAVEAEIASLQSEMAVLREQFAAFRGQFE